MNEEEIKAALDAMNGGALRAAASLGQLTSAQLAAAQAALAMSSAQKALANAENEGSIAGREAAQNAIRNLQIQDAMRAARAQEAAAAKADAAAKKATEDDAKKAAQAMEEHAAKVQAATKAADAARAPQRALGDSMIDGMQNAVNLGGALGQVQNALSKMGPYGQAAAVAIGVVGMAVEATVGRLKEWGQTAIEVVERASLLRAAFTGLAGGAAQGAAAGKLVEGLVDTLPFAKQQTEAWATSLLEVGEAGATLAAHVRAIAAAQALTAVTGGQGGAAAQELFTKLALGGKATESFMKQVHEGGKPAAKILAKMGLNIRDLGGEAAVAKMNAQQFGDAVTKALQARGAPALAVMMNSWPNILEKAREGMMSIFGGLTGPVEGFMGEVRKLFSEFSKGGVAVNLLKPIVTAVFGALFRWGTMAINAIHRGFLLLVIGGLQLYIAMRPAIDAFGKILAYVPVWAILKVILGSIVGIVLAFVGPFLAAAAAVGLLIAAIGAAVAYFSTLADDAMDAGGSIVNGLVQGVTGAAGQFMDALSGLASKGLAAFKGIFGIASPSKVMLEHGEKNIAGATASGIDRGADKVDASMAKLGGSPQGGAGARGEGNGGVNIYGDIHVSINGAEGPASAWDEFVANLHALRGEAPQPT
jgi:hypothetical protein